MAALLQRGAASGAGRYATLRLSAARGGGRRALSVNALAKGADHSAYIKDVAGAEPSPQLPLLLRALEARGDTVMSPNDRAGLHPLVIPLSKSKAGEVTALLRWASPPDDTGMPVVKCDGPLLQLLARNPLEFVHRAVAEEDAQSGGGPISAAVGESIAFLYTKGAALAGKGGAAPRHGAVDVYLTREVGKFPDVMERLIDGHLAKGDETSALVTVDWYQGGHFKGWARPSAFASALLERLGGRPDEARDAARIALSKGPWWTVGLPVQPVITRAGFQGLTAAQVKKKMAEAASKSPVDHESIHNSGRTPQMAAMEDAETLLDAVAAGEHADWDSVCEGLVECYTRAGKPELARFIGSRPKGK